MPRYDELDSRLERGTHKDIIQVESADFLLAQRVSNNWQLTPSSPHLVRLWKVFSHDTHPLLLA
jgi:hypothetical protein